MKIKQKYSKPTLEVLEVSRPLSLLSNISHDATFADPIESDDDWGV